MNQTALVPSQDSDSQDQASWTRILIAFGAIVAGMAVIGYNDNPFSGGMRSAEDYAFLGFVTAIVASPFAMRSRLLSLQVAARAVLLQLTVFGVLVLAQNTFVNSYSDGTWTGVQIALTGLIPLFILGRRGLHRESGAFAPNLFRNTLLASLLFGLADTWALLFYALFDGWMTGLLASAGLMATALYGLYHLKVWGLVLCIIGNLVVASLALSGALDLPDVLVYGLAATAGIQLLLPVPVVARMLKARRA